MPIQPDFYKVGADKRIRLIYKAKKIKIIEISSVKVNPKERCLLLENKKESKLAEMDYSAKFGR